MTMLHTTFRFLALCCFCAQGVALAAIKAEGQVADTDHCHTGFGSKDLMPGTGLDEAPPGGPDATAQYAYTNFFLGST